MAPCPTPSNAPMKHLQCRVNDPANKADRYARWLGLILLFGSRLALMEHKLPACGEGRIVAVRYTII